MTLIEALNRFRKVYWDNRSVADTKNNFYCGITNDLANRNIEHGNSDVLDFVQVETFDMAIALESMMHYDGFDTGRHLDHVSEDSTIVYLYKKGSYTEP